VPFLRGFAADRQQEGEVLQVPRLRHGIGDGDQVRRSRHPIFGHLRHLLPRTHHKSQSKVLIPQGLVDRADAEAVVAVTDPDHLVGPGGTAHVGIAEGPDDGLLQRPFALEGRAFQDVRAAGKVRQDRREPGVGGIGIHRVREHAMIYPVHRQGQADLVQVALAASAQRRGLRPRQRGQQERGQDGDDGDDHQQLDEREGTAALRDPAGPTYPGTPSTLVDQDPHQMMPSSAWYEVNLNPAVDTSAPPLPAL
jgi:hypothetical protein